MDLTLYKMSPTGRINLTGLVSNRETFFTGERDKDTGVVTLTPVNIVGGRTSINDAIDNVPIPGVDQAQDDDNPPFDA